MIKFNKPYKTGKELEYIEDALQRGHLSGNGHYSKACQKVFEDRFGILKCLLTTSCTDALEMSALLINLQPGDEVIVPSYTFVSTANAFVLRGAKIVFADSEPTNPNLDVSKLEELITERTKAIIPVHYAGVACDMDPLMELAEKYNVFVIEDAAQAVDSYYKGKSLATIGHMAAYSFHETKNIISGEGGALAVNDERFVDRAEIIWEKGTNRSAFFRGQVDKYNWVDVGSSFLPSEMVGAFLYAQLEHLDNIQQKRLHIWNRYHQHMQALEESGYLKRPFIPGYATNNAHMYYIRVADLKERSSLIQFLKEKEIKAVFHYLTLHDSPFYNPHHDGRELPFATLYADQLIRLPFYYELEDEQIDYISDVIRLFFEK